MPPNKRYVPPTPEQHQALAEMLAKVQQRTIVRYDWPSPAGKDFLTAVRHLQVRGVSLPAIADTLGLPYALLDSAVAYWTRSTAARRRHDRRPAALKRSRRAAKRGDPT
jgi:hypothetical protein